MNLDDWANLIRYEFGPADFRSVAIEFLREHYGALVSYADGTGDGGVDAWVLLRSEPRLRLPAQFHAGKAEPWERKLEDDVKVLRGFHDGLAPEDPVRLDLAQLLFVCTQTPSAIKAAEVCTRIQREYHVSVQIFDARAIASLALQTRGHLLSLLAQRLPGAAEAKKRARPSARDELLMAFAFFHTQPAKYRREVAKSSIATVLHRHEGSVARPKLLGDAAALLRLSSPSRLLVRALRDLTSEHNVTMAGEQVLASPALSERTTTALQIAAADEEAMRRQCADAVEPSLPRGVHHRADRARRAADAVFDDLGLMVRGSVAGRALNAVEPDAPRLGGANDDSRRRWDAIGRTLAQMLDLDHHGLKQALAALARVAADAPFARSLAAAELFLQISEYDPDELPAVLASSSPLCVTLDASIAMPMLCALYDQPARDWETSVAAHTLHESLRGRGARLLVPSVYVEEMAAHLIKARGFAGIIETETELERSGNFFVAHFCSTRSIGAERSAAEFREFLAGFAALPTTAGQWQQPMQRRWVERELYQILARYGLEVVDISVRAEDPELIDEPGRDERLLKHDRAVVRWLTTDMSANRLLCTADRWLQGVLAGLGVTALDSAALTDLLELMRPTGVSRGLLSPLAIAQALTDEDRTRAAAVWDRIVALENDHLADWKLLLRAREFRAQWLKEGRDLSSLPEDWLAFRNAGIPAGERDGADSADR